MALTSVYRSWLLLLALIAAPAPQAGDSEQRLAGGLDVEGAYVHVPLPGRNVTAAYFSLLNKSEEPRRLVGVETAQAARAEIHSHTHVDGMMRMRREQELDVPARGRVDFAPGGLHIMLFELAPGLQTGDELHLTLIFSDASRLPVVARARSRFDQPHN